MKKITLALLIATLLIGAPFLTQAEPLPYGAAPEKVQGGSIWVVLTTALNWLFNIVIFISAIFIVVAGFNYVISSGDPEKVKRAMQILIYALVGVAVAILAKTLVFVISNQFLGLSLTP